MIIKGKSRSDPSGLAAHLGNEKQNDRVKVIETRGTVANDLRGALIEMDAYAAGTQCSKPLYHANIDWDPSYSLSLAQKMEMVDALEERLGLGGHPRLVVEHEKHAREHLHVVWARTDLTLMRAVHDGHNYRKHEEVARDLERRFGHDRVQGAHVERDGVKRPDRTPSRAEIRQEERTNIRIKDVKADVTAAFRSSDTAEAFKSALEEKAYILAKGDRRDFVVIDREAGIHSLARRIDGIKAAELREFMKPIDRERLPTADLAQAQAQERKKEFDQSHREALKEKGYSRGDSYVSQTQAALKDHIARQEELDRRFENEPKRTSDEELLRRQAEETTRRQDGGQRAAENTKSGFSGTAAEMTDAKQERFNRLLNAIHDEDNEREHPDPDRQREAPGGGRTRSR